MAFMNTTETDLLPLVLRPGQATTLPELPAHELLVLQGRLWLTRSGDPGDHFLDPGERFPLPRHGRTVIEADGALVRCRLLPLAPASPPLSSPAPPGAPSP